jgi:predicted DNA-binding protein YlxM (UPF0122 family)
MDMFERMSKGDSIHSIEDYLALCGRQNDYLQHRGGIDQRAIDKEALQDKVKQISASYSEEKQKLDLMMKIQQARQRAILQRKLLERKQQAEEVSKIEATEAELAASSTGEFSLGDRLSSLLVSPNIILLSLVLGGS